MKLSEKLGIEVRDIAEWPDEPRIKHQHEDWAALARKLEAENEALKTELARLRGDAFTTENVAEWKRRAYAFADERDALRVQVDAVRADFSELRALADECLAQRDALRVEVREANGEIEGLQTELRYADRQGDALRATLDAVREELTIYTQADTSNSYATTKAVCRDILAILDKGENT